MSGPATVFMLIWVYFVPATDQTYMTYGADFTTMAECESFASFNFNYWIGQGNPVSHANYLCVETPNASGRTPSPWPPPRI